MLGYVTAILIFTGIYAMISLGLNIQWGMTGLINLGQVAFMAVGAYVTALLMLSGCPFPLALVCSASAAAALGVVVAVITPRLQVDYLAIFTLGFSQIVRLIFLNEKWIANGPSGVGGIPQPFAALVSAHYQVFYLGLTLAILGVMLALSLRIARFPLGRVFRAIREDQVVAASVGKPVLFLKIEAFALGAAFAGLGGAFFATYLTFISPDMFTAHVSVFVLVAVLVATPGSSWGTLAGITAVAFLLEGTRVLKDYIPFVTGVELAALRQMAIGVGLMAVVFIRYSGRNMRR